MHRQVLHMVSAVLAPLIIHLYTGIVIADENNAELAKQEWRLGVANLNRRSYEGAVSHFEASYKHNPKDLVLFDISQAKDGYFRGMLGIADYEKTHNVFEAAIKFYDRFIASSVCRSGKEQPKCQDATRKKARLFYQYGVYLRHKDCVYANRLGSTRFELATTYFESAMTIFDSIKYDRAVDGLRELALLYSRLSQCKRAKESLEQYKRKLNSPDRREAESQGLIKDAEDKVAFCKEVLVAEISAGTLTTPLTPDSAVGATSPPRLEPEAPKVTAISPDEGQPSVPSISEQKPRPPITLLTRPAGRQEQADSIPAPLMPRYQPSPVWSPPPISLSTNHGRNMRKVGIALVVIGGISLATGGVIGFAAYGLESNVERDYQRTGVWTLDLQRRSQLAQETWPISYYTAGAGAGLMLLGGVLWGSGNSWLRQHSVYTRPLGMYRPQPVLRW